MDFMLSGNPFGLSHLSCSVAWFSRVGEGSGSHTFPGGGFDLEVAAGTVCWWEASCSTNFRPMWDDLTHSETWKSMDISPLKRSVNESTAYLPPDLSM